MGGDAQKEMASVALTDDPKTYAIMDPYDAILRSVRLTSVVQGTIDLHGEWSARLPHEAGSILIYLQHFGHSYVISRELPEPLRLEPGDALLVPWPSRYGMADDKSTPLRSLRDQVPTWYGAASSADELLVYLHQSRFIIGDKKAPLTGLITSLRLFTDVGVPSTYLRGMPRFIVLPAFLDIYNTIATQVVENIRAIGSKGLKGQAVATRLAEALLTLALQTHFRSQAQSPESERGLSDPLLAKALSLMHQQPEAAWTINRLAQEVGLSRSALLKRFRQTVGATPLDVLLSMRMRASNELLERSDLSIANIALKVGYGSEAAFNRAYRRWSGLTPGLARRQSRNRGAVQAT